MKYKSFTIHNYKAIKEDLTIDLTKDNMLALIGLNECGKSTILKAILAFDYYADEKYKGQNHLVDLPNYYDDSMEGKFKISALIQPEDSKGFQETFLKLLNENENVCSDFGIKLLQNEETEELEELTLGSENFIKVGKSLLSKAFVITRFYDEETKLSKYTFAHEKFELSEETQNKLSEIIVQYLPFVNYLHSKTPIKTDIKIEDNSKDF